MRNFPSYVHDSPTKDERLSHSGPIGLVNFVVEYISRLSPQHRTLVYDILYSPDFMDIDEEYIQADRDFIGIDKLRDGVLFRKFVSHGQELKVFFQVPNKLILSSINPTLNPNEAVAVAINFFLLMVEAILCFEEDLIGSVKGSFEILHTELGFLITFLGDKAMHLQPTITKNIVINIEALVNEVGNFFYSFFFTIIAFTKISNATTDIENMVNEVKCYWGFTNHSWFDLLHPVRILNRLVENCPPWGRERRRIPLYDPFKGEGLCRGWDIRWGTTENIKSLLRRCLDFFMFTETRTLNLAFSYLLRKFDLLKTKIKKHCITVSNMPSDMAPKTSVVSPFIVDSVLDDLKDLLNNKSDKIVGVNDQIVMLHEELMLLGSSVKDIAVHQAAEYEELVIQAGDITYEVEYVINSFLHVWYLALRLPQLIEKIQLFMMAIKEIKNNVDAAGMPEVAAYPDEQISLQSKKSPALEDTIVGFKKVATEIAEQLVRGTDHLQIISIYGMPGLGKTTLANKLYNDPSVVYRFDKSSWCVISQTYNKKNVLIEILSSMSNSKREAFMNMEEEKLAENIYKNLKGRRYLIVIDDIWDVNVWNDLRRYFPDDGIGSRILFTTRNKEAASKASSRSVINALPFLSEVECWELLQRKVFQDKNCPQELIHIGKQIATNCSGLPLAVVVIAGVLANMEKKEHFWQEVARNLSSYISETPENCFQTLELSYKHLPMHLKPCFLYFGAFEEDKEISVKKLIWLWVAEGYIRKEEQKCSEDVALKYLMELIDRSLVIVVKRRFDGEVKTCKIHDILHEMCCRIAEEKKHLKMFKFNHDDPQFFSQVLMYQQHRCLSIDCRPFANRLLLSGRLVRPPLNSRSFKVLRFLKFLDVCADSKRRVPIGNEHLPPMEIFHKLEFLILENTHRVEIPEILLNMVSLRHMHFSGGACFNASCRQQATEDENFLINNNLQSISVLLIYDATDEKILRCLSNLRRLKARVTYSLNHSFEFLNQLESLKLLPDPNNVRDPCFTLIGLPLNLRQLTLVDVHMSPKQLEVIGKLQCLEILKLVQVSFEGRQWDTSEVEFPQLKFLKLRWVQIAEWNASSDNFPRLQKLVLQNCYNLKMIPPSLGDILTLQKIEVHWCAKAIRESAKQIQEEQKENGNEELKVVITEW
ncbi:late blight resistance homolog R1A-3 isoform X1 [Olea europaea subsp. europaea]|uniref:Late blight resistance homolog R1A-3 isoform X1 n=1 Tax=Olea europaea subsp. europaea TaxID=158383 RepID=A0A8S0QSL4_OLEEU|nr:late blight resistance homolog R1A-3 isoform X1 [Olea europaea subsp. europaea]